MNLTQDFIQYWSAFQLAASGANPYNPALMWGVQLSLDPRATIPILLWAPPWVLLVLAPILWLPFHTAALAFMLLGVALLVGMGVICGREWNQGSSNKSSRWRAFAPVVLAAFFYPALDCLGSGQLGIVLAAAVFAFLFAIQRGAWGIAGGFASLLLLKPHLFLFVPIALLFVAGRPALIRSSIGFTLAVATLALATEVAFPGITRDWLAAITNGGYPAAIPTILTWRSDALSGFLRGILFDNWGMRGDALLWLVPLVGAVGFSCWLLRQRVRQILTTENDTMRVLLVAVSASLLFAPYGWVSDLAILLPVYLFVLGKQPRIIGPVICVSLGFLAVRTMDFAFHHLSSALPLISIILVQCSLCFCNVRAGIPPIEQKAN